VRSSPPAPTPRSCSRRGGDGDRVPATLPRHVRLRHSRSVHGIAGSLPATSSGSSRCTTCRKDGVVFASEIKALVSVFGSELVSPRWALVASMLYYWVPDQMCHRCGWTSSRPGAWAEFRPDGTHHVERYWDIAEEAAAAQECHWDLREVIEESVNAHLVADVPVSSFLSGGLDSSIVTVLAKQANPQIDAYTITFRAQDRRLEAMPDDAVYARKVAAALRHRAPRDRDQSRHRRPPAQDGGRARRADRRSGRHQHAAHVRGGSGAGVKVILSGMGADELFGGYRKHLACVLAAATATCPRSSPLGERRRRWPTMPVTAGVGASATPVGPSASSPSPSSPRRRPSGGATPSTTRPSWPRCSARISHRDVDDVVAEHTPSTGQRRSTTVSTGCAWPTPGCSCPGSTSPTPTAPAWPRPPRSGAVRRPHGAGPPSRSRERQDPRSDHERSALKDAAEAWLPPEIVHRPKASFGAPLRAWVSHDLR
jgi:asparagine synthase (glutamine-hydrolysing)